MIFDFFIRLSSSQQASNGLGKQNHHSDDGCRDPEDDDTQLASAAVALLGTVRLKKGKGNAEGRKREEVWPDGAKPCGTAGKPRRSYERQKW
jgi:hypothetical protein